LDPAGGPAKLTIGWLVDSDVDGFPGPNADGDDKSIPGSDDEEAIATPVVPDGTVALTSLPKAGEAWMPMLLIAAGLIAGGAVALAVARRRA
jgi:LPXTG-motif cell wall-anchored protein